MTDKVRTIRLWDPLLRGFHWLLATLVIVTWIVAKVGPDVMTLHFWLGYTIIGLLAFRVIWGLIGPRPARFTHFIKGPRAVLAYARHLFERRPSYWPGHNPMGGLSVIAMLGVLIWQVFTGLIADPEDFVNYGPLSDRVPHEVATDAVGWHFWGGWAVLALVVLHLAVIAFYRIWKREDLVRPMITGDKPVNRDP